MIKRLLLLLATTVAVSANVQASAVTYLRCEFADLNPLLLAYDLRHRKLYVGKLGVEAKILVDNPMMISVTAESTTFKQEFQHEGMWVRLFRTDLSVELIFFDGEAGEPFLGQCSEYAPKL